ncbi:MAG TPA: Pr6Pr family membrane protein [Sphingomicrobium sp.]|nr:Pr6Pr family membrane protein [Sphingomicrobium sp.]
MVEQVNERMGAAARLVAGVCAVVVWAALALQLKLIADNLGFGLGVWRYFGYFTILTNIGVALVATAVALGWRNALAGPRARFLAATSIVLVGLVYSIALRSEWNPTGLQKVADFALHDASPLLFIMVWILAPNGTLGRRDFWWALAPPSLYAVYALARGAVDGWYAYYFFDPNTQSLTQIAVSIGILVGSFAVIAAVLLVVDGWLGRHEAEEAAEDAANS